VRDDENYWQTVESYFAHRTNTIYSHGVCPDCYTSVVLPDLEAFKSRT
jgi:hypothetical protein